MRLPPLTGFNLPLPRHLAPWSLLFGVLGLGLAAAAQPSESADTANPVEPRVIEADLAAPRVPVCRSGLFSIGACHAATALYPEYAQQLAVIQREIGFRYIRFHGILDDDMRILAKDGSYDWSRVDQVHDLLLRHHLTPFVELSYMPTPLASGKKTVFWYKANVTPPADFGRWSDLIRAFARHAIQRYGEREVQSWFFEVWNEPDHTAFYTGDFDDYLALYRATATALKAVSPALRVGGPATAGLGKIPLPRFVRVVREQNLPLDFLSSHAYGAYGALDEFGTKQLYLRPENDAVARKVRDLTREARDAALPLYITEWSASYSSRDPIHDSHVEAAYVLQQLRHLDPAVGGLSYWTFTDIFEESGPAPSPFHGGFGLLTREGIRKPAFFAFKYFAELGDREIPITDKASWVTEQNGKIAVLLWDLELRQKRESNQVFYRKLQPPGYTRRVAVVLHELRPGRYGVKLRRVGFDHNDAYSAYLRLGAPKDLTPAQEAALRAAASDAATEGELTVGADGNGTFNTALAENEVAMLTIESAR